MTSVEFVEKALIGSLLNDSTRRDELPWLRAEDFTNPLCRALWRHLESGNPTRGQQLPDLVDLSETLGRAYELHPQLRSPAELATLQFQAPENPELVAYGRILVEATIRRAVTAMGLRLESLATGEPEQIIDRVADALVTLDWLDQRWEVSMGRRGEVDPDLRKVNTPLAAEAASPTNGSWNGAASAIGEGMNQKMAEQAVLGAVVHDWPIGARTHVFGTVRTYDFTDARIAATWRAVEHLEEHDEPIDEITVLCQALRARRRTGDGLTLQELRETRDAALFHEAGAIRLARSTLTRVADQAKIAITRCAEDLRISPAVLMDSVATHHVAVAAVVQRLTGEPFPSKSLAAIKDWLLDQARPTRVREVNTSATFERSATYPTDLGRSNISP